MKYWDVERRDGVVAFYARAVTARRAVPLGLLALRELARRRPEAEIVLFGEARPIDAGFAHRDAGVLGGEELARLYSEATVGCVLARRASVVVSVVIGSSCFELPSDHRRPQRV